MQPAATETTAPARRDPAPPRGLWLLGAVILVIVVAAFWLSRLDQEPPPPAHPATTVAADPAGPRPIQHDTPLALSDSVPGLHGTFYAVAGSELVTWSTRTFPPKRAALPTGSEDVRIDYGHSLVAFTSPAPHGRRLLAAERATPVAATPVATGVDDFAWHERQPGRLAWIESAGSSERLLLHGDARTTSKVVVGQVPADEVLTGWTAAGLLLTAESGVRVVTETGSEVARFPHRLLAAGPDGELLLADDGGLLLVAAPGQATTEPLDWQPMPTETTSTATWSTAGSLAVVVRDGNGTRLLVWDGAGRLHDRVDLPAPVTEVSWRGDGAFVLMPRADQPQVLLVYDPGERFLYALEFPDAVTLLE